MFLGAVEEGVHITAAEVEGQALLKGQYLTVKPSLCPHIIF